MNIISNYDTSKIFDRRTREYFKEVLTSYSIGNYRSSIVSLYITTIGDLLFKMQEMTEQIRVLDNENSMVIKYNEIKNDIERNPESPRWENTILEYYCDTNENLLSIATQLSLETLKKTRNLCAHPSFEGEEDISLSYYNPSQEQTAALIKAIYIDILIKPPFLIGNIDTYFLESLNRTQDVLLPNRNEAKEHLISKFYSKMSKYRLHSIFKSLFKLTFNKSNDIIDNNRNVQFLALDILCDYTIYSNNSERSIYTLLEELNTELEIKFEDIPKLELRLYYLYRFLPRYNGVYNFINQIDKQKLEMIISDLQDNESNLDFRHYKNDLIMLNYFSSENLVEYMDTHKERLRDCDENTIRELYIQLSTSDEIDIYDYFIESYGLSRSFHSANNSYKKLISPYYEDFDSRQLNLLLDKIESNSQVNQSHEIWDNIENIIDEASKKNIVVDSQDYPKISILMDQKTNG